VLSPWYKTLEEVETAFKEMAVEQRRDVLIREMRADGTILDHEYVEVVARLVEERQTHSRETRLAQMTGIVLPVVGQEIDRLAKLWDGYEAACERIGLTPDSRKPVMVNAPALQQINVYDEITKQMADWPEEARQKFADALRIARETHVAARMAEVDARVRASLPVASGEGD
jgi:hypothetical protein